MLRSCHQLRFFDSFDLTEHSNTGKIQLHTPISDALIRDPDPMQIHRAGGKRMNFSEEARSSDVLFLLQGEF